jgi:hypothetical protein
MADPKKDDSTKGDNRSNTDRDGNRGGGNQGAKPPQPGNIPERDRTGDDVAGGDSGGNPGVGHDENRSNRDRGDGTKRSDNLGDVS